MQVMPPGAGSALTAAHPCVRRDFHKNGSGGIASPARFRAGISHPPCSSPPRGPTAATRPAGRPCGMPPPPGRVAGVARARPSHLAGQVMRRQSDPEEDGKEEKRRRREPQTNTQKTKRGRKGRTETQTRRRRGERGPETRRRAPAGGGGGQNGRTKRGRQRSRQGDTRTPEHSHTTTTWKETSPHPITSPTPAPQSATQRDRHGANQRWIASTGGGMGVSGAGGRTQHAELYCNAQMWPRTAGWPILPAAEAGRSTDGRMDGQRHSTPRLRQHTCWRHRAPPPTTTLLCSARRSIS